MNLPSGKAVKTGIDVASTDFIALLRELSIKKLSGYLAISVRGFTGIEEGAVVFDAGKLVASVYEYHAHAVTTYGQKAFFRVLNATNARNGVIDIFQLPPEQVQLALAFNEKAVFVPPEKDLNEFRPGPFAAEFEKEIAPSSDMSASDVAKKYRLTHVKSTVESGQVSSSPASPPTETGKSGEDEFKRLINKL